MPVSMTIIDNGKLKMSAAAQSLMRSHERAVMAYYDDGGKPGKGNCTWGIGTLAHLGPCTREEMGRTVSPAEVESAFSARIVDAERLVQRRVKKYALNQLQFDALVSFVYNTGPHGAASTLDYVDAGELKSAADAMSKMIYMTVKTKTGSKKIVARGLIPRRVQESAPFRTVAE